MSSNHPYAYPGYPPAPNALPAPSPSSFPNQSAALAPAAPATDPYAAYYAQMMADPAYAAYAAQYYAAYGATAATDPSAAMYGAAPASASAAASASSSAAHPVSLDLDQVILKSEITRKPAAGMKKSAAGLSASPVGAASSASSSSAPPSASDSSQATDRDAPAADASVTKKKKRKAGSEMNKADKEKAQEHDEEQPHAKKKRMIRYAAGQVWEDKSLVEWPDNDFRLFVGDLGPEVMTQTLEQAFGKYASFQKAHVVRDQRTGKSKGYGFVSFMNGEDFVKAFQEYNNKYLGSRPVKLRKSTWQERNIEKKKEKLAKIFK